MSQLLLNDIEEVKKKILSLSALVEESVLQALDSFDRLDNRLAQKVIQTDISIDHKEIEVEDDVLKILALHQPVAIDLRFLVSVLKINNDLERIGDLAVNIAEQTIFLSGQKRIDIPDDYMVMAKKASAMLSKSLDALVNLNVEQAREIFAADDEVDDIHTLMFRHVKESIPKAPEQVDPLLRLLLVCRHVERIADLATNIAEDVIYMVEGEIVRHQGAHREQ